MEVIFKNFRNRHIMLELPTIKTDFLFENSQDFNQTTHARPQHPIVFIHNISLYYNCISSVKYVFKRSRHSHIMPFSAVRPKPWNFQHGFQHTLKYLTWSSTQFSTWFIPYVTTAGLRASNSQSTSVWPEWIRLGTRRVITATGSVTVMEYYFYLLGGLTH